MKGLAVTLLLFLIGLSLVGCGWEDGRFELEVVVLGEPHDTIPILEMTLGGSDEFLLISQEEMQEFATQEEVTENVTRWFVGDEEDDIFELVSDGGKVSHEIEVIPLNDSWIVIVDEEISMEGHNIVHVILIQEGYEVLAEEQEEGEEQ